MKNSPSRNFQHFKTEFEASAGMTQGPTLQFHVDAKPIGKVIIVLLGVYGYLHFGDVHSIAV